jgi:hypothetical protein
LKLAGRHDARPTEPKRTKILFFDKVPSVGPGSWSKPLNFCDVLLITAVLTFMK